MVGVPGHVGTYLQHVQALGANKVLARDMLEGTLTWENA